MFRTVDCSKQTHSRQLSSCMPTSCFQRGLLPLCCCQQMWTENFPPLGSGRRRIQMPSFMLARDYRGNPMMWNTTESWAAVSCRHLNGWGRLNVLVCHTNGTPSQGPPSSMRWGHRGRLPDIIIFQQDRQPCRISRQESLRWLSQEFTMFEIYIASPELALRSGRIWDLWMRVGCFPPQAQPIHDSHWPLLAVPQIWDAYWYTALEVWHGQNIRPILQKLHDWRQRCPVIQILLLQYWVKGTKIKSQTLAFAR